MCTAGVAALSVTCAVTGCSSIKQAVGLEEPCDKAERLSKELEVPFDEGATTIGDLEDNMARHGEIAQEAMEAAMECLRKQPLQP